MATEAQIQANRLNAQKSTGPRTAEGKAVVAQNAIRHGLWARQAVVMGEFESCRDEMLAELAPEGPMESALAQRAVGLAWRLRRANGSRTRPSTPSVPRIPPARSPALRSGFARASRLLSTPTNPAPT